MKSLMMRSMEHGAASSTHRFCGSRITIAPRSRAAMSRRVRRCSRLAPNRRQRALSCTQYRTCSILQHLAVCSLLSSTPTSCNKLLMLPGLWHVAADLPVLRLKTLAPVQCSIKQPSREWRSKDSCRLYSRSEQNSPPPDLCRGPPSEDGRVERMSRCLGGASPRPRLAWLLFLFCTT